MNGVTNTMSAICHLQNWADQRRCITEPIPEVAVSHSFPSHLSGEAANLLLLSEYNVPVARTQVCGDAQAIDAAAQELGFPLVLKTAEPGVDHKSNVGGVVLNLLDRKLLQKAYTELSARLGAQVIVQQQAAKGIELAFGCVVDPDFGPLVMVSPGGTLVEFFNERQFARAPFGPQKAEAMIRKLTIAKLIEGVRGDAPRDMTAAANALSNFSCACAALKEHVLEIDVNPVVVTESYAVAVDALIVPVN